MAGSLYKVGDCVKHNYGYVEPNDDTIGIINEIIPQEYHNRHLYLIKVIRSKFHTIGSMIATSYSDEIALLSEDDKVKYL